jgi:hypothetical protein
MISPEVPILKHEYFTLQNFPSRRPVLVHLQNESYHE